MWKANHDYKPPSLFGPTHSIENNQQGQSIEVCVRALRMLLALTQPSNCIYGQYEHKGHVDTVERSYCPLATLYPKAEDRSSWKGEMGTGLTYFFAGIGVTETRN